MATATATASEENSHCPRPGCSGCCRFQKGTDSIPCGVSHRHPEIALHMVFAFHPRDPPHPMSSCSGLLSMSSCSGLLSRSPLDGPGARLRHDIAKANASASYPLRSLAEAHVAVHRGELQTTA